MSVDAAEHPDGKHMLVLGLFGPLGIAGALLAVAALFLWPLGFWLLAGASFAISCWFFWSLKRAPHLQLPTLSPTAQELLERYHHAWSAPGLTRGFSFLLGIGQLLCIFAGIYFAFQSRWVELGVLFMVFNVYSYFAGVINPALYIRRHGMVNESQEIAVAYVEYRNRKAEAHAARRARDG